MTRHQHKRPPMPLAKVKTTSKETLYRRIVAKAENEKREYSLHATKGYRSFRKSSHVTET